MGVVLRLLAWADAVGFQAGREEHFGAGVCEPGRRWGLRGCGTGGLRVAVCTVGGAVRGWGGGGGADSGQEGAGVRGGGLKYAPASRGGPLMHMALRDGG